EHKVPRDSARIAGRKAADCEAAEEMPTPAKAARLALRLSRPISAKRAERFAAMCEIFRERFVPYASRSLPYARPKHIKIAEPNQSLRTALISAGSALPSTTKPK